MFVNLEASLQHAGSLLYTQLKYSMFSNKISRSSMYIYVLYSVTFGAKDTGCLILFACTVDVVSNHVT